MKFQDLNDYSRRMYESAGPKAIAIAAQKARDLEDRGRAGEARTWRKIEETLKAKTGPRQG